MMKKIKQASQILKEKVMDEYQGSEKLSPYLFGTKQNNYEDGALQGFKIRDSDGSILCLFKGMKVVFKEVAGSQSKSESNSDIPLLGLKELIHNADEALVELAHAKYDPNDYKNAMKNHSYQSKYSKGENCLKNPQEAREFFDPDYNEDDGDIKIALVMHSADKNHGNIFCLDQGIGKSDQDFRDFLMGLTQKTSSKANLSYPHGKYNSGLRALPNFQNKLTPKYRGALSKAHPLMYDHELATDLEKNWNFCLDTTLSKKVFGKDGALEDHPLSTLLPSSRINKTYTLEFIDEDNNEIQPVLPDDYVQNFEGVNHKHKTYKGFNNPESGTVLYFYDTQLNTNSKEVVNHERRDPNSSSACVYVGSEAHKYIAYALNKVIPSLAYTASALNHKAKIERQIASKSTGATTGGTNSKIIGFYKSVEEHELLHSEKIELGTFTHQLSNDDPTQTKIKVDAYYANEKARNGSNKPHCFGGIIEKAGGTFSEFTSSKSTISSLGLQGGLHKFLCIVVDYEPDGIIKSDITRVSRDSLDIEKSIKEELKETIKTKFLENARIQEIISEFAKCSNEDYEGLTINLLSEPTRMKNLKRNNNDCLPDDQGSSNCEAEDFLRYIEVDKAQLKRIGFTTEDGELEAKECKVINPSIPSKTSNSQDGKKTYRVRLRTNAKAEVLDSIKFSPKIEMSSVTKDGEKVWKQLNYATSPMKDGLITFTHLQAPTIDSLSDNVNNSFELKITPNIPKNHSLVVDNFSEEPLYLPIVLDAVQIERSNNPTNPPSAVSRSNRASLKGFMNIDINIRLLEDKKDFYGKDGEYIYYTAIDEEGNITPMTEENLAGFVKVGDSYKGAINLMNIYSHYQVFSESDKVKWKAALVDALKAWINSRIADSEDSSIGIENINENGFKLEVNTISKCWNQSFKNQVAKALEKASKKKAKA